MEIIVFALTKSCHESKYFYGVKFNLLATLRSGRVESKFAKEKTRVMNCVFLFSGLQGLTKAILQ